MLGFTRHEYPSLGVGKRERIAPNGNMPDIIAINHCPTCPICGMKVMLTNGERPH